MNIEQSVLFRSGLDLDRLVADAEASGFNPLTVLRAGGAAAYLVTEQHVGTPKAPVPKPVTAGAQNSAALFQAGGHVGSPFGGNGGSTFSSRLRERKAKREERRVRRERKAAASRPSVPASGSGGFGAAGAGAAYGAVKPVGEWHNPNLGKPSGTEWTEEIPTVTNPYSLPGWQSNPFVADVETGAEARYGEGLLSAPESLFNRVADLGWNVGVFAAHIRNNVRAEAAAQIGGAWDRLTTWTPSPAFEGGGGGW